MQSEVPQLCGTKFYSKRRKTKVVLFWNMVRVKRSAFQPNGEVDKVIWLSPRAAVKKLRCATEHRLVSSMNLSR